MITPEQQATKCPFQLGRLAFDVVNCEEELGRELAMFLPRSSAASADLIVDAQSSGLNSVLDVLNYVYKQHTGVMWLGGASVVTPNGKKVLLFGRGHNGKSTTMLALAFGYNWKVVSEDITLIDMESDEILNFAAPFAVRIKTLDLLSELIPPEIISETGDNQWIALGPHNYGRNITALFDIVIYFDANLNFDSLRCTQMSGVDCLKALLPSSNLMKIPGAMSKIEQYLGEAAFYQFSAGTVQERVQALIELVQ